MAGLAVVGGHNLLGTDFAAAGRHRDVEVGDVTVGVLDCDGFVMLQRHGLGPYVAPHDIDHVANARALVELGCDRVLAIASVGSLRIDWPVGTFLVAADFVALTAPPLAIGPGEVVHGVAAFDPAWRARVWATWDAHDAPVLDGGVYWQTTGPRFETPAEIRVLATFADVVGMTVGSECVAACQVGLAYAPVCIVDNLANGLGEAPLTTEEFDSGTAANRDRVLRALDRVLPELSHMNAPLAVVGARLDGVTVGLRAVEGVITDVGPDVGAAPGDEVVDGAGLALVPGLVNGHGHAAMTLFRGYGGDLPLMEWLQTKIWPAEARLDDEDVYWGTRLACLEMIRSGTIRFWDMYWHPVAVARAVDDSGLRAAVGLPLIDGLDPARGKEVCADAARTLDELEGSSARVTPSLTPHGIYTVSEPSLQWVAQESAARDVPVHIHFLETADEVTGCVERTGEQPTAYLDRIGLLNPKVVLAHGCYLDDAGLEIVAARGATIVTNPVSNLKLAVGRVFPLAAARAHGIGVGIGTDGAASNNGLDLLQDVKFLALIQKHAQNDPAACPASDAWAVATGAWAPGLGAVSGLAPGAPADFLLVREDAPELGPGHLIDNLVYSASGSVVDTTVVAGNVLMRGRVVDGEEEVRVRALERAQRLGVTS